MKTYAIAFGLVLCLFPMPLAGVAQAQSEGPLDHAKSGAQAPDEARGPASVPARIPRLVRFAGTLTDGAGTPLDGIVGVVFAVYAAERGGTPLWQETQNVQADAQGHFSVLLGAADPGGLPLELFFSGDSRWLGIRAQSEGDSEQPRVLLVSVPYALKAADAETLGGRPASAYALVPAPGDRGPAGHAGAATELASSLIPILGVGTAGFLPKFNLPHTIGNSALFDSNGLVGIGTTHPSQTLEVVGNIRISGVSKGLIFPDGSIQTTAAGPGNGTGTVTQVNSGAGLTGGPFTTSGTLALDLPFTDARYLKPDGNGSALTGVNAATLNGLTASAFVQAGAASTGFEGGATFGGKVGIGTQAPTAPLEVAGDVRVTGVGSTLSVGGNVLIAGSSDAHLNDGTLTVAQGGIGTGATFGCTPSSAASCLPVQILVNDGQESLSVVDNASGAEVASMDSAGVLTAGGILLHPSGTANAGQGAPSNALDVAASAFDPTSNAPEAQRFRWQVDPVDNDQISRSGRLSLLFGQGSATPSPTGLSVTGNGIIDFAPGQTFPGGPGGGAGGTVTSVGSGLGLIGGPITSAGILSIDPTVVPQLGGSNTFLGNNTFTGSFIAQTADLDALDLPNTASATVGVLALGGMPFLHDFGFSSTFVGQAAGNLSLTGSYNTGVGNSALLSETTGGNNSAFGVWALRENTEGNFNSGFGVQAMKANTTGSANSAFGLNALFQNTTGDDNSAFGYRALEFLTDGSGNIALGSFAGRNLNSGSNDIYIGHGGSFSESNTIRIGDPTVQTATYLAGNVSASGMVHSLNGGFMFPDGTVQTTAGGGGGSISAVLAGPGLSGGGTSGSVALSIDPSVVPQLGGSNTFLGDNTFTGPFTGQTANLNALDLPNTTSASVGVVALGGIPFLHDFGLGSTFVGQSAGNLSLTGSFNTGVGNTALQSETTGGNNSAVGAGALMGNTEGQLNTGIGVVTLKSNTTGSNNSAVGVSALNENTTGDANSAFGARALEFLTAGSGNIAVGYLAGRSLSTGSNDIYIGHGGGFSESNTIRIGDPTVQTATYLAGNVSASGMVHSLNGGFMFPDGTVQTTAGGGGGSITAVIAGSGLIGGGTSGAVAVSIDPTVVPQLGGSNTFLGDNTFTGSFTGQTGNLNALALPDTASASVGVLALGGTPFLHNFGTNNTFVGASAGNLSLTGTGSSAFGFHALKGNTTGDFNSAFGASALSGNTSGSFNAAFGFEALSANPGNWNAAFGMEALLASTGTSNAAFGGGALVSSTNGDDNAAFGASALSSLSTGSGNIALGKSAGGLLTSGSNDIYIGNPGGSTESNTIRIGDPAVQTATHLAGNVSASGMVQSLNGGFKFPDGTVQTTAGGGGGGSITAVNTPAGGGLMGGGATGALSLGLVNSCTGGQVLQWTGTAWVCATVSSGAGVTSVAAGLGLAAGPANPIISSGTLGIDPAVVPQLGTSNVFTGAQNSFTGGLTVGGSGSSSTEFLVVGNAIQLPEFFKFRDIQTTGVGGNTGFSGRFGSITMGAGANVNAAGQFGGGGGQLTIAAGNGGNALTAGTYGAGGVVQIQGGSSGFDGVTSAEAGSGALLSVGGGVGNSTGLDGRGGALTLIGGSSGSSGASPTSGGSVTLNGGTQGTGGSVQIAGGGPGLFGSGLGGSVSIQGGVGGSGRGIVSLGPKVGINTTAPAQALDVSGSMKITGGSLIFADGTIQSTAATGGGGGTITGVSAGQGLSGGGTSGTVSLAINPAVVPLIAGNNSFLGNNDFFGSIVGTTAGFDSIELPDTASSSVGVLSLGGLPFLHDYGTSNTFVGAEAGNMSLTGSGNTGVGELSLGDDSSGFNNAAFGRSALAFNANGSSNAAFGAGALVNLSGGNDNIAVGAGAGANLSSGDDNIYVGNFGMSAETGAIRIGAAQTATYIAGIAGIPSAGGTAVFVDSDGKLGSITSSRRFKTDIDDMGEESDVLMRLRPVAFYYKPDLDATRTRQYGLVAEEVAQVAPELVVFDKDGEPETVRYHFVNAMLLNEVQKERHLLGEEQRANAEQETTIARQQAEIRDLSARLARLEEQLAPKK